MKKGLFDKFREMLNTASEEYEKRSGGKSILEEVIGERSEEEVASKKEKGGGLFDKWFGKDDEEERMHKMKIRTWKNASKIGTIATTKTMNLNSTFKRT